MPLAIAINETKKGAFLVTIAGELDTNTYKELEEQTGKILESATAIVIDLKDLAYISSMGLRTLYRIKKTMHAKAGSFLLINPQKQVKLVFETIRIISDDVLASLEEADELLDGFLTKVQRGEIKPHAPLHPPPEEDTA